VARKLGRAKMKVFAHARESDIRAAMATKQKAADGAAAFGIDGLSVTPAGYR